MTKESKKQSQASTSTSKSDIILTRFAKRLLRNVPEQGRTAEEIFGIYDRIHPSNFIQKKLGLAPSLQDVEVMLDRLHQDGLVSRDPTWYTDRALSEETLVYMISDKGRDFFKKNKK
jgi:hypothetical protein